MILRLLGTPGLVAIAFFLQGKIPGVKNLYPWAFPLMVGIVAVAVLVFIAAVRLQIPKNLALMKIVELRNQGYVHRNNGFCIGNPETELEPWKASYYAWEKKVKTEVAKLSPLDAKLLDIMGDVPVQYRGEGDIPRYANFFTFQTKRLEIIIEKLRK